MVIHPSHLAIVNEAFTPSSAELDEWKGIVAAMEDAEREGLGAIRLNGRLIDVAHVHTARKELARANASASSTDPNFCGVQGVDT